MMQADQAAVDTVRLSNHIRKAPRSPVDAEMLSISIKHYKSFPTPTPSAISTLAGIVLGICIAPAHCVAEQSPSSAMPRRVSSCFYVVGFLPGDDKLSDAASALIKNVVADTASDPKRFFTINGSRSPAESRELSVRRGDAIAHALINLGIAPAKINVQHLYNDTDAALASSFTPCAPTTPQKIVTTMGDIPDYLVKFQIAGEPLAVPLKYLEPPFWHDIPYETVETSGLHMNLVWPGLESQATSKMRVCYYVDSGPCNALHLAVDVSPLVPLRSVPSRPLERPPTFYEMSHKLDDAQIALMASAAGPDRFMGIATNGIRIVGYCGQGRFYSPLRQLTVDELRDRLGAERCNLSFPDHKLGLKIRVDFSGTHFSDWREIIDATGALIRSFSDQSQRHLK